MVDAFFLKGFHECFSWEFSSFVLDNYDESNDYEYWGMMAVGDFVLPMFLYYDAGVLVVSWDVVVCVDWWFGFVLCLVVWWIFCMRFCIENLL